MPIHAKKEEAMMNTSVNLDKLRNAVQRFGTMSFTTVQVAQDYFDGETAGAAPNTDAFDALLHHHALLLGIGARSDHSAGNTVWQSLV